MTSLALAIIAAAFMALGASALLKPLDHPIGPGAEERASRMRILRELSRHDDL